MKKNLSITGLFGIFALMLALVAFLMPIAPGISASGTLIRGYDFVFTNNSTPITIHESDGLVAMFVLFIVGSFLELVGTAFGWWGGKFGGFLAIAGGICMIIAGALVLASPLTIEPNKFELSLAWGFIATAAAAILSGLLAGFGGVKAFLKK
mgnify:CR=1 FL=1